MKQSHWRQGAAVLMTSLTAAGCNTRSVMLMDLSDFASFSFSRAAGSGFSVFEGTLLSSDIQAVGADQFEYSTSVVRVGVIGQDPCLDDFATDDVACPVERPLSARTLSGGEAERMLQIFAAVEIDEKEFGLCQEGIRNSAFVHTFTWDNFQITDALCTMPRVTTGGSDTMILSLEFLTDVSELTP